jgi:hypothetical protein
MGWATETMKEQTKRSARFKNAEVAVWDHGEVVEVTLCYPRQDDSQIQKVRVCLSDVRAADFITIEYDFERDGWVIKKDATNESGESADGEKEVAFVEG